VSPWPPPWRLAPEWRRSRGAPAQSVSLLVPCVHVLTGKEGNGKANLEDNIIFQFFSGL